jgi:hypothetical protein
VVPASLGGPIGSLGNVKREPHYARFSISQAVLKSEKKRGPEFRSLLCSEVERRYSKHKQLRKREVGASYLGCVGFLTGKIATFSPLVLPKLRSYSRNLYARNPSS